MHVPCVKPYRHYTRRLRRRRITERCPCPNNVPRSSQLNMKSSGSVKECRLSIPPKMNRTDFCDELRDFGRFRMSVPNLNLINFEHPACKNANYILTSPKSLKACQKAGVKPVELLYRSLADVKKEFGHRHAAETYEKLEKERQQKLDTCRRIRNELLMQGFPYCRTSSPPKEHQSSRIPICTPGLSPDGPRSTQKSEAGSFDSNKTNYRDQHSPFPSVKKPEQASPIGSTRLIATPLEVSGSPLPMRYEGSLNAEHIDQPQPLISQSSPLPHLKSEISYTRGEGGTKAAQKPPTPRPPSNAKHKKKFVRSQSLPSRPGTPRESSVKMEKVPSRTASSLENYLHGRKFSSESTDFTKPARKTSVQAIPSFSDIPSMDKKLDHHVLFEDINNNHFKAPTIMRPPSARKKTQMEKRFLECKKVFDKIRAQYKDPDYCLLKYKQIIENSIERELREQEVKKVQRRIEEGFEMWQDRVLMLQWLDSERAEEQVTKSLSSRIEKMRQKQRNKEIVHAINMNKVKEEDDIRAEVLRRELTKKERKIQELQEEKERVIFESKNRALAVSELKEQIRNIMTPETFDRKVNKCGRESKMRVFHPPVKCPAIMQKSHISLG